MASPVSSSSSATAVELAPQITLTPEQHLNLLLGCGALGKSWATVAELEPDAIIAYYTALGQVDERLPQPDQTYPKHPEYGDYSLMYAEPMEQMAALYFGATPEQLHLSQYYFPDEDCYAFNGLGSVASCAIRNVEDGAYSTVIRFDIFWDGAPYADGELTIDVSSDGSWRYSSFELAKPNVTAEQREQWYPVLSLLGNSGMLFGSWGNGNEIPSDLYTSFYLFTLLQSPEGTPTDSGELVLPAKEFEDYMQARFDVSTSHLQQAQSYDADKSVYVIHFGVGSGGGIRLESVTEQDDKVILNYIAYGKDDQRSSEGSFTLQRNGDTLRYISHDFTSLKRKLVGGETSIGQPLDSFEQLTEEQKALYTKGLDYLERFDMTVGYFSGDTFGNDTPEDFVVDGKYIYHEYTGSMYKGWDDFYNDCLTVFTKEFFDRVNMVDYMDIGVLVPLYINHNGKLYHLTHDRGGNQTYVPETERYVMKLSTDNYVCFSSYNFYSDRNNHDFYPPPAYYCPSEVILRRGESGWRIDHMILPY